MQELKLMPGPATTMALQKWIDSGVFKKEDIPSAKKVLAEIEAEEKTDPCL
jgi:hypothetical protein